MKTEIRNATRTEEILARLRRQSVEATRQGDFRRVARLTLETERANAQLQSQPQAISFSNPRLLTSLFRERVALLRKMRTELI